jgi:hypothetical protein
MALYALPRPNSKLKALMRTSIEITGPGRNRNLYRVHVVQSETEIVATDALMEGEAATLIAETQPAFTPLSQFFVLEANQIRQVLAQTYTD